jgi:tetratricopeptide (TPR) repeat protein
MGLMYHASNQTFEALDCFAQVAKADPTDRRAFENIGLVYCDLTYFDLAVGAFSRAIDILPTNAVNYYYRGKSLLWLGRYESAAADFTRAIDLRCEEPQVYNCRALAFKYQRKHAAAIADLTKALTLSAEMEFFYNRAMCYAETGQYDKAVLDLTEALKIDRQQSRLHFLRGKCDYLMGKYADALVDLRHARTTDPNASDACECFYFMGLAHARLGEYAAALQHFSEAVSRKPNCAQYVHERAKALQVEGRWEEAVRDFSKVLALQPLNAHALFRRAFAWKAIKRFEEAADDFEAARKLQPLNYHLVVNFKRVYDVGYVELCAPGDEPPYEEMVAVAEAARATAHVR